MNLAQAFRGPQHQPFRLEGGAPAALLLHGFPGTPAETRALGEALQRAGWTAHGLLLPGFGAELETLGQRHYHDWVEAAVEALGALQQERRPTLLVGYSMGAAVATLAATQLKPDGLALLAPFAGHMGCAGAVLPVLRRLAPTIRPFRLFRTDFSKPGVQSSIANFFPDLDLDNPAVQQSLRDFAVPTRILDEVRRVGKAAWQAAPSVAVPTLVLQGAGDVVVRPASSRRFAARLAGPARYEEIPAAHDLLDATNLSWPEVERAIIGFAQEIERDA